MLLTDLYRNLSKIKVICLISVNDTRKYILAVVDVFAVAAKSSLIFYEVNIKSYSHAIVVMAVKMNVSHLEICVF